MSVSKEVGFRHLKVGDKCWVLDGIDTTRESTHESIVCEVKASTIAVDGFPGYFHRKTGVNREYPSCLIHHKSGNFIFPS